MPETASGTGVATACPDTEPDAPCGAEGRHFGVELNAAIEERLDERTLRRAHRRIQRKAAVIVAWYVASYVLLLLAGSWWLGIIACTSLALSMAGVGFNIQHDANHNALFARAGSRAAVDGQPHRRPVAARHRRQLQAVDRRPRAAAPRLATNVVGKDYDIEIMPFARMAPQQRHRTVAPASSTSTSGWSTASPPSAIIVADVIGTIMESFSGDRHGKRPSAVDYTDDDRVEGTVRLRHGRRAAAVPPVVDRDARRHLRARPSPGFLLGIVFQLAHVSEQAEFCDARRPPRHAVARVAGALERRLLPGPRPGRPASSPGSSAASTTRPSTTSSRACRTPSTPRSPRWCSRCATTSRSAPGAAHAPPGHPLALPPPAPPRPGLSRGRRRHRYDHGAIGYGVR